MSFPVIKKGSGSGGNGSDKKSIFLSLSENIDLPAPEISIVPFDTISFNNGMAFNAATSTITVPDAGNILITAAVGIIKEIGQTFITAFIFKNGVYLRQHASSIASDATYGSSDIPVLDRCAAGDEYQIYATVGGISGNYTVMATEGLTGFELSYL